MRTLAFGLASVALLGLLATSACAQEEFNAYLLPEQSSVEVGGIAEITFEVDETAHQFNAYEITLLFDPEVVSFDSVEEGPLMIEACGNRWDDVETTDSTVTYVHGLLCPDVSIDGPGILSYFYFHGDAAGVTGIVHTSNPNTTFYDEGLFIWPGHAYPRQVILHNATLTVGLQAIGDLTLNADLDAPWLSPNPVHQGASIHWSTLVPGEEAMLEIIDIQGRRLCSWSMDSPAQGDQLLRWSGTDLNDAPLPSGTYFCRLRSQTRMTAGKFRIIR